MVCVVSWEAVLFAYMGSMFMSISVFRICASIHPTVECSVLLVSLLLMSFEFVFCVIPSLLQSRHSLIQKRKKRKEKNNQSPPNAAP